MIEYIENIIYAIIVLLVIIIFIVGKRHAKPAVCATCKGKASNYYDIGSNTDLYCRPHLVERWKKDMQLSKINMMAIEPDFAKYPYGYIYDSEADMVKWNYPKGAVQKVKEYVLMVSGKNCADCNNEASVAYFLKQDFKPSFFEKMTAMPTFLCKTCFVKKVEPLILGAKEDFEEGLYAPGKESGAYHVQVY
ncbi:MAG TPA: hypothetical protein VEC13_00060 [Candidatus Paceibacterota bacterium]|nr:hypothetical protein [Candidatus Paceibacterota bacterium]